ncbi:DUF1269 domain-containing family protein [Lactobacillus sp. ESL0681]|uniref:DUF1269 domain-containing family protein n=1 Tax=Lactobacillus sp. ESL0681 TaxID=2983211 RepID=UPI0023F92B2B|nr:DUF1269 domain-containing family protein [Lactobacillus sp. ESL0681]WEV40188.1 DUF1269 domain-containing family protein [Lactobacillus sp. ESL0681]
MKKTTSAILGTIIGCAAGFVAGSLLVSDDRVEDLKRKVKENPTANDLKQKYDNGTEIVKNQLTSFPKKVEDDSELKDFDDIVIDSSDADDLAQADSATDAVADMYHAEPTEPKPDSDPVVPTPPASES